jgi:crotonobetainyl-CoA:carnitine CoA-transferase CaiB-like acyl-CoA transferase
MKAPDRPIFGPLRGLRVLDMTVALAGAFTTMLLSDMGAEIIKLESRRHYPTATKGGRNPPRGNDPVAMSAGRDYPDSDPGEDPWNRLSWFNAQARGKLDATLEVGSVRGREMFLRLVEKSDGLIENNAPGLLEKLGVSTEVLWERNPRLIVVRMPPLGLSGPDYNTIGFGWHFEDLGGFYKVQGYADGEEVGSIFMDGASGPAGANAFLLALLERRRTGKGSICEVSQVENMICHIGDLILEAQMNGRVPIRWGNRSPDFAPQGVYRCAGADAWLAVSVRSDEEFAALRRALGDPESLRDPSFDAVGGRRSGHDVIDAAIATWALPQDKMAAAAALQEAGVPAGAVLDEADASSDPQLHARHFFEMLVHPSAGAHFHAGANFHLGTTPTELWRAAPTVGQDNDYVYREIIGVSDAEWDALVADGQIGTDYL